MIYVGNDHQAIHQQTDLACHKGRISSCVTLPKFIESTVSKIHQFISTTFSVICMSSTQQKKEDKKLIKASIQVIERNAEEIDTIEQYRISVDVDFPGSLPDDKLASKVLDFAKSIGVEDYTDIIKTIEKRSQKTAITVEDFKNIVRTGKETQARDKLSQKTAIALKGFKNIFRAGKEKQDFDNSIKHKQKMVDELANNRILELARRTGMSPEDCRSIMIN